MSYVDKQELEIEDSSGNAYLVVKISPEFLRVDLGDVVELMKEAGYDVFGPSDKLGDGCPLCGVQ